MESVQETELVQESESVPTEEEINEMAKAVLAKSKPTINGVMQGDLNPEEYLANAGERPNLLGYTMSVLRTNPLIKDWYYSDFERYDNHVIIDSLINGLNTIIESEHSLNTHLAEYPFFERAYKKYLLKEDREIKDLLGFLYLYS
jgi:hypothetical protein